jgi:hypothetical protein
LTMGVRSCKQKKGSLVVRGHLYLQVPNQFNFLINILA